MPQIVGLTALAFWLILTPVLFLFLRPATAGNQPVLAISRAVVG